MCVSAQEILHGFIKTGKAFPLNYSPTPRGAVILVLLQVLPGPLFWGETYAKPKG